MSGVSGSNPIVSRIESVFPYKRCPPPLPPPPSSHHFTYSCLLSFLVLKPRTLYVLNGAIYTTDLHSQPTNKHPTLSPSY